MKAESKRRDDSLPDYSKDWDLYKSDNASNAEIEARFYYEFARESKTILKLAESLCHFSPHEILRGVITGTCKSYDGLIVLHPRCIGVAWALAPDFHLQTVGWNDLKREQKDRLILAFSPSREAFRQLDQWELSNFESELIERHKSPRSQCQPKWLTSSRFFWGGIEEAVLRIDWNAGSQAVKDAMKKWFLNRKRELPKLARAGLLPGNLRAASYYFRCKDETGAKNPRRKHMTALHGLGAMRLLGRYTLTEAIDFTKGAGRKGDSLFYGFLDPNTRQPTGRSAWNKGIKKAWQTFQELFYPQDEYALRIRRLSGLPKIEEPISYQRYCLRTGKNK